MRVRVGGALAGSVLAALAVSAQLALSASAGGEAQDPFPNPATFGDRGTNPAPRQDTRAPQPPVFRSKVEAIAVDVFVTDASGNPVAGLTADDFELEEDGTRQPITTFQAVQIPAAISSTDFPPAEPDVASNDGPEGRIYVIAFGAREPDQALRTRVFLRQFIERHFGPHDVAAVVQLGKGLATDGQDFTGNRRLLLAAIDKLSGWSSGGEGFKFLEDDPRILTRAIKDLVEVLGRMPGRHKSLLYFNTRPGYAWGDLIDYSGRGVGCFNVPGCQFGSTLMFDDAHGAMTVATRNNLTIYPIDPRGVINTFMPLTGSMDFKALAELTGGFAHRDSNDYDGTFERIVRDASTYYMLGFNSGYTKNDGKYVRLKVRVSRPGLTVRARTGYVNTTGYEYEAQSKTRTAREPVVAALANPLTSTGHPLHVVAAAHKGTSGDARVVLTIETALVPGERQPRAGVRSGAVHVRYLATDARKKIYPEIRHRAALSQPVPQATATGDRVRLISEMQLPQGRYQIRVAGGSDRSAGGVIYDLEVPDFSGEPLTMSSLSVAAVQNLPTLTAVTDKRKVKTRTCNKGECVSPDVREVPLVAWDQKALPSTHPLHDALPAPPTAARAFTRSQTIVLFAEVYDNKGARPLDVRALLRGPDGSPALAISQQLVASTSRASGGQGVTLRLPLADLSPGRYVLRLEAAASSEHVTAREIPVNVLP